MSDLGIKTVEWILFTDHHREQCQGIGRLDRRVTRMAAPGAEQAQFERPNEFRKWFPKLDDEFSVYGASYVRPPRIPIPMDRVLEADGVFEWRGDDIRCRSTPGHSPGGMSFTIERGAGLPGSPAA